MSDESDDSKAEVTSLPQVGAEGAGDSPCEGCDGGGGRRGFLFAAGSTLLAMGGGLAAVPIITVVVDPGDAPDPNRWIRIGAVDDFEADTTVLVQFGMPWD